VEITGPNSGDFTASNNCAQPLAPGQRCVLPVHFTPSQSGDRTATLVIHQNLPAPDHGTPLELTGTGTPQPLQHTLTVNVNDPAVTVTSNPSGITDCSSACHQSFNDGANITLTANYDNRSNYVSWGDGCTPPSGGDTDTCTVHLVGDTTITVSRHDTSSPIG
jgi:hypothetical protein